VRPALAACALVLWSAIASAQTVSQRGFVEGRVWFFPETAPNDATQFIGDALWREEVFVKPAGWLQFAAGLDLRANSHDQVESAWRLDVEDRGVRRPRAAVRRLAATVTAGRLTVEAGKQFIRWARADILNPTDRFAPRDFLNVVDTEFLPVLAVRPSLQVGSETLEAVWVPRPTPSRVPLLDQRWTVAPAAAAGIPIEDGGSRIPRRSQQGVRWRHVGERFDAALSYFDGINHLPDIETRPSPALDAVELLRVYPRLRTYGGDLAIPTRWVTLKSEAAYFTSPASTSDEYLLYVVEAERQSGEWVLDGGYAGEIVTSRRQAFSFSPERGLARSIIGRASYTVDPRRTVAIEAAVRQNGNGVLTKGEYSQAFGQHWRLTWTGVAIAGHDDDFLGQYHRNSHVAVTVRLSF
jgi:hypothetical protein